MSANRCSALQLTSLLLLFSLVGPRVSAVIGEITTVVGNGNYGGQDYSVNGPGTSIALTYPSGVAIDAAGDVYIADTDALRVRKWTAHTGDVTMIAGGISQGTEIFASPVQGVGVDASGAHVFIVDSTRVFKWTAVSGLLETIAGDGESVRRGGAGAALSRRRQRCARLRAAQRR